MDKDERAQLLKQRDALKDTCQKQCDEERFAEALETAQKMLALDYQMQGPDNDDAAGALS